MSNVLQLILDSYGNPENPNNEQIDRDLVVSWMGEHDLNTLGALYSLLTKRNYSSRIHPELTYGNFSSFFKEYYSRCIREDPDDSDINSYLMSRYSAGRDLSVWVISIASIRGAPANALTDIREWLAALYLSGDNDVKKCLMTSVFEHIFINKKIAKAFRTWERDPDFKSVYSEAITFARKHHDQ